MAFDLKKWLAENKEMPGETEVTLSNGVKVTLQDLRDFSGKQDEELELKRKDIGDRERNLAGREAQLGTLAEEVAKARAALETRGNGNPSEADIAQAVVDRIQAAAGGRKINIFEEPGEYFKPLVDKIAEMDTGRKAIDDYLKTTRGELEKYLTYDNQRQMRRDYRTFKEWPEGFDLKKAVQYATQNRLLDEMGYPDFDRIHEAVTAPARQAADLEKEREKIRKEEQQKARKEVGSERRIVGDTFVPTPGASGGGGLPKPKFGGIEKIDESAILNDPDILATFANGNSN